MTKAGKVTIALVAAGLAGALGGAMSCGSVSESDVQNARNEATTASCSYYKMCKQIGGERHLRIRFRLPDHGAVVLDGPVDRRGLPGEGRSGGAHRVHRRDQFHALHERHRRPVDVARKCPVAKVCPSAADGAATDIRAGLRI